MCISPKQWIFSNSQTRFRKKTAHHPQLHSGRHTVKPIRPFYSTNYLKHLKSTQKNKNLTIFRHNIDENSSFKLETLYFRSKYMEQRFRENSTYCRSKEAEDWLENSENSRKVNILITLPIFVDKNWQKNNLTKNFNSQYFVERFVID